LEREVRDLWLGQGMQPNLGQAHNSHSMYAELGTGRYRTYLMQVARVQPKWGIPGECPHDSGVSVFEDRYLHAARAQMGQDGRHLSSLDMSNLSMVRTLFLMKQTKRLLTSSHHVEGAFVSKNKSPIVREAEKSPMLQYQTYSVMGLRNFLKRSSGWRACGQESGVSINVVDELQMEGHLHGMFHDAHGHLSHLCL